MKVIKQKHKVVDNFLPIADFNTLHDTLMSGVFPWFSDLNGVGYLGDYSDKYFIHTLYRDHQPNSEFYPLIAPILERIEAKSLIRAKANLYVKGIAIIEHAPHIDFKYPHKAFILYLNDNDGFTRMPDGQVVESVANRGVFFSGSELHNSTNCTNQLCRANISINYF
jgi:hypothetical protein